MPCRAPQVPLAQLFAADFPEITFPEGKDLVQLMWRVEDWGAHDCIQVFWRRSVDVTDVLAPLAELDRGRTVGACILDPERISDFPWYEELPDEVLERLHEWNPEREESEYNHDGRRRPPSLYDELSTAPGFKVGGSMDWSITDMPNMVCPDCDAPSALLLQLDTYEWAPGRPDSHWRPLEDRHLVPGTSDYKLACEPTGLTIGSASHGGVFVCSMNPEHAALFRCQ